jgi:hypothetical protein
MALIVEDGSTVANAQSYITVVAADTYHSDRGHPAWALLDLPTKEASLRLATDFMVDSYRNYWKGYRNDPNQALENDLDLSRYVNVYNRAIQPYFVPSTIVPREVKESCAEFALVASTGQLNPNVARGQKKVKVGVLEVEYDGYAALNTRLSVATGRLSVYLRGLGTNAGTMVRLVRS